MPLKISVLTKQYVLVSAICHLGATTRAGHYVTVCFRGDSMVVLNDRKCDKDEKKIKEILKQSYILFYEKE